MWSIRVLSLLIGCLVMSLVIWLSLKVRKIAPRSEGSRQFAESLYGLGVSWIAFVAGLFVYNLGVQIADGWRSTSLAFSFIDAVGLGTPLAVTGWLMRKYLLR